MDSVLSCSGVVLREHAAPSFHVSAPVDPTAWPPRLSSSLFDKLLSVLQVSAETSTLRKHFLVTSLVCRRCGYAHSTFFLHHDSIAVAPDVSLWKARTHPPACCSSHRTQDSNCSQSGLNLHPTCWCLLTDYILRCFSGTVTARCSRGLQFHPGQLEGSIPPRATVEALLQSPKRRCLQRPQSHLHDRTVPLPPAHCGTQPACVEPALACNFSCPCHPPATCQARGSPLLPGNLIAIPLCALPSPADHFSFHSSSLIASSMVSWEIPVPLLALSCFHSPNPFHWKPTPPSRSSDLGLPSVSPPWLLPLHLLICILVGCSLSSCSWIGKSPLTLKQGPLVFAAPCLPLLSSPNKEMHRMHGFLCFPTAAAHSLSSVTHAHLYATSMRTSSATSSVPHLTKAPDSVFTTRHCCHCPFIGIFSPLFHTTCPVLSICLMVLLFCNETVTLGQPGSVVVKAAGAHMADCVVGVPDMAAWKTRWDCVCRPKPWGERGGEGVAASSSFSLSLSSAYAL
ncbi:uncharacterized protein LOC102477759 [Tupaia chinensis]|uniref:uncharacterized protein LOC102477759 n=1 Tax=Tupaia chinensis TaxID=246437 RepID=UPI000FFC1029|nr:uncharacterized protein LOC102477759 [Tupaia chinensis]XP_027630093.1 uncharacterized protein LOC102477759 [Tupaia chinensis]XP_027630094.1 uncharacterized protein LOC102477759 [Tupaia chinensis]